MGSDTNTRIRLPRRGLVLALAAAVCASLVATGMAATVTIYDNDFKSRHEFKTVRKAAGGKACKRTWHKRKAFGVVVKKRKADCAYELPVYSDGSGGNVSVKSAFKVFAKNTTSKIRRGAFAFLALRASDSTRYQVRVFPKANRWELRRTPGSRDFPVKGKLKKIAPLDKRNVIQARVVDDTIDVWIQGKRVVRGLTDSDAAKVSGKAIRLGIGQTRKAKRRTRGLIHKVRVDLPGV